MKCLPRTAVLVIAGLLLAGCSRPAMVAPVQLVETQADTPAVDPNSDEAKARASFETVAKHLERQGVYKTPDVYVITIPRNDLMLAIDGMAVPPAAGIESVFNFYYCPCGKTNVVGQFCVLDYEANDVIDALRAARIEIVSVAPMLLHTRNAPIAIRFFAESKPEPLGKAIREALRWTGKERMAGRIPMKNAE